MRLITKMGQSIKTGRMQGILAGSAAFALALVPVAAQAAAAPTAEAAAPAPAASTPAETAPVTPDEPVMHWGLADAKALLAAIEGIGMEGLFPADYQPDALRAAIAAGAGEALDKTASRSFAWLAEDLRDGRTPVKAREQWFALDPDRDTMPTAVLMAIALASHDIAGVLASLDPTHPDYGTLKALLMLTPENDEPRRALIRANMDRWRWLAHDLGKIYLITNVPEFRARLVVNSKVIQSYRTIVGKPGKTATPQLAVRVRGVVFNPTWTVPQSIVQGEKLGAKLLANPAKAQRENYKVTVSDDGTVHVVQQPGPKNALGLLKLDMPNPHAIYMHDTPAKSLFNTKVRAYSHGCIRTENAVELGMTLAILGAQMTPEEVTRISESGEYTKVALTTSFPVYIGYFTMGRNIDGKLVQFADIYDRDPPVIASFEKPRARKTAQRISDEPVIQLDNPL